MFKTFLRLPGHASKNMVIFSWENDHSILAPSENCLMKLWDSLGQPLFVWFRSQKYCTPIPEIDSKMPQSLDSQKLIRSMWKRQTCKSRGTENIYRQTNHPVLLIEWFDWLSIISIAILIFSSLPTVALLLHNWNNCLPSLCVWAWICESCGQVPLHRYLW